MVGRLADGRPVRHRKSVPMPSCAGPSLEHVPAGYSGPDVTAERAMSDHRDDGQAMSLGASIGWTCRAALTDVDEMRPAALAAAVSPARILVFAPGSGKQPSVGPRPCMPQQSARVMWQINLNAAFCMHGARRRCPASHATPRSW